MHIYVCSTCTPRRKIVGWMHVSCLCGLFAPWVSALLLLPQCVEGRLPLVGLGMWECLCASWQPTTGEGTGHCEQLPGARFNSRGGIDAGDVSSIQAYSTSRSKEGIMQSKESKSGSCSSGGGRMEYGGQASTISSSSNGGQRMDRSRAAAAAVVVAVRAAGVSEGWLASSRSMDTAAWDYCLANAWLGIGAAAASGSYSVVSPTRRTKRLLQQRC